MVLDDSKNVIELKNEIAKKFNNLHVRQMGLKHKDAYLQDNISLKK